MLAHGPQILTKAGTTARAAIPGLQIACDLPQRPRPTTPTGCTPWRRGSWARPSNRPQATLGCWRRHDAKAEPATCG